MAFIHRNKFVPQRAWTLEETKISGQRAWTVEETKLPHRPNSASAVPRVFQGVVVNPSFQRPNETVETVHEEDLVGSQLTEPPQMPHTPHCTAIKRENINVLREWDVKSIKGENVRERALSSRPLVALMAIVSISSFLALLLTLLILFGSVETRNCSCSGNVNQGKSVDKNINLYLRLCFIKYTCHGNFAAILVRTPINQ